MIDRQKSEHLEKLYEDEMASRYNEDYHEPPIMKWQSNNFSKFVKSFYHPGDRVLDLGCGPASMWPFWEKNFNKLTNFVGVDLSPKMIDEAKRLFPYGDFREGSFFNIPAEAGAFDMVIVSSALHHIADKDLPAALSEIDRVLDEHGILVGREPLAKGRFTDRGGWLAGCLMNLRHYVYRLTHTREFPEPDPGPDHHAYDIKEFLKILNEVFFCSELKFMHPVSNLFARVRNPLITKIAQAFDEFLGHKEGQEIFYVANKNYVEARDVSLSVRRALEENYVEDITSFLVQVEASIQFLRKLEKNSKKTFTDKD